MAKRPTNKAKIKVWTERATCEMEGGIKDVTYHMFMFVSADDRQQLIADMQEWHDKAISDDATESAA